MTDGPGPESSRDFHEGHNEKPDLFNRYLAKFIDLLIVLALSRLDTVLGFIAPLMGLTYILISDGLFHGASLGKMLIGLKVVIEKNGRSPCTFKHSTLRNIPIGIVVFFLIIPFWGWVLFFTLGLLIIGVESYQIYQDPSGFRLGDLLAETRVVDKKTPE